MLLRLDTLLAQHEQEVAARLAELASLQQEIARYRRRVAQRIRNGAEEPSKGRGKRS